LFPFFGYDDDDDDQLTMHAMIGAVVTGVSRTARRSTAWLVISSTPSSSSPTMDGMHACMHLLQFHPFLPCYLLWLFFFRKIRITSFY
jgi:hypothetical protein